jgi:protease IV
MKNFLKYFIASVLGVFVSLLLLLFTFMIIISVRMSSKDKLVDVKPNTILHLTLDKPIVDRASDNPFDNLEVFPFGRAGNIGLNDILDNIRKAGKDDNVDGIFLDLSFLQAGMATVGEIRDALIRFREQDKFVISYSDSYTQGTLYLASAADKIYMNPIGVPFFLGLRSETVFLKGTLDKLGLEPQIIRHGKFKSAVEPLMLDKMSQESREQVETFLGSMWDYFTLGISEQRGIPVEKLNELANQMAINNAASAVEHGLIDGLKYRDEVIDELKELTGTDLQKDLKAVKLSRYKRVPEKREGKLPPRDKVAVIYASGPIGMGEGSMETIGSEGTARAIREARKDSSVKAIVFRINSGGGSALASEVIWREAALAAEVKPFIASMGDVAASGGYYVLAAADTIVASPSTITGSIGVFGVYLNMKKFLNEKIGMTVDVVKTNPYADFGSPFRNLTAAERTVAQGVVEEIYSTFVNRVAEGRTLSYEQVDEIGQGRVWSGENAMEIGLVDVFGGLEKAVEIAAEKAGLEEYRVIILPKAKDPFEELVKSLTEDVKVKMIRNRLGTSARYYEILEKAYEYQGIQARIPFEMEVY